MRPGIFLLIFVCTISSIRSQVDNEFKDAFIEAQSYFLFEEYEEALPVYSKLLRNNPYNNNLKYLIGRCLLNNPYRSEQAIKYLEEASNNINPKYKEDSYREIMAPQDVIFYLAEAYQKNSDIEKAIKYYEKFIDIIDPDVYDVNLVHKRIRSCNYALAEISKPVKLELTNMGEGINSNFEENNPVISGDGKTLAFTRKLQFYDAVFVCYKTENGWTAPENIISQLGVDGNVTTSSLNYRGNALYIYSNDNYDGNLYVSLKNGNTWGNLRKLNSNINTKFWESNAFESPDGEILYFSSNRPDGAGRLDIYMSYRQADGSWGPAINLGIDVNTPFNDDAPFVVKNGKVLIYSSYGHTTIGDYDYFYSVNENGIFGKAVNMGYPLNTTGEEILLSTTDDGKTSVLSVFNENNSYGLKDIYLTNLEISLPGYASVGKKAPPGSNQVESPAIENIKQNRDTFSLSLNEIEKGKNIENTVSNEGADDQALETRKSDPESAINEQAKTDTEIADPQIKKPSYITGNKKYNIDSGSELIIPLTVENIKKLKVQVLNGASEDFNQAYEISESNFVFKYLPKVGENIIKFVFTDKQGIDRMEIVSVTCTPPTGSTNEHLMVSAPGNNKNLIKLDEVINRLKANALNKNLAYFIDSASGNEQHLEIILKNLFEKFVQKSFEEDVREASFETDDVLKALLKSTGFENANINEFFIVLTRNATPAIREYITGIKINEYGFTPLALLKHIIEAEPHEIYSKGDIYETLSNILMGYGQKETMYPANSEKGKKMPKSSWIAGLATLFLIIIIILISKRKKKKPENRTR